MGDHRSLKVWQLGHQVTLDVYRATRAFPSSETYGITSQLRRAAASVPANIAEGAGRNTTAEYARFCRIALGSANEVDYHLLLARDLGYLSESDYAAIRRQVASLRSMLARFIDTLVPSGPIADSR
jgi:four helix bundle protein